MATNKTKSRNTSTRTRTYKRPRGNTAAGKAAKKKNAWACFLGIFATLAIAVTTTMLILEYCTAYKPSNGFKKVVPETEETETLPDKTEGEDKTPEPPAGGEQGETPAQ